MPELPEVEAVRRSLVKHITGRTITEVTVLHPKTYRSKNDARLWLTGRTFSGIDRRAKLLIFRFSDDDDVLTVHLRMTGQLLYQRGNLQRGGGHSLMEKPLNLPDSHTRIVLTLDDGGVLFFNDQRLFGVWHHVRGKDLDRILRAYGPEPATPALTLEIFTKALAKRVTPLKAALLDQRKIAGLGNIYVDEACFRAGVRPMRKASSLTKAELLALFTACHDVIAEAIELGGTTFHSHRDADGKQGGFLPRLQVYGRTGKPCLQCKTPIKKVSCAQRGTHFCPKCQK